ncbi:YoaK family protein [Actinomycetospora sp. OC33-EN08]|uniref:YoaK family protein n=1 Tax=Actinomycetospora aurantiaca TaxID=3129233 RepID=A0ABU8MQA9_9PSEU
MATPVRWDGALLRGPVHGPLPALLLVMTTATGLVDAVSVLGLGRVFVANMTGNVVFLGFAVAGAPGFALAASLAALGGFLVGALAGGAVVARRGHRRGHLLRDTALVEVVLMLGAVALLVGVTGASGSALASVVAALLAVALGLQNAVVRRLAVPDLTTTVLTMTLTGIAADVRGAGRPVVTRRVLAVATMFLGALAGALLVDRVPLAVALVPAPALLLVVVVVLQLAVLRPEPWQVGPG